jgi:hypothetical protein
MSPKKTRHAQMMLAKDFRRWGRVAARRVLNGVKKYGVQFYDFVREKDC